jgi:formylglycine-generating enzyme required for sulfatase activity
MAGNVWEWVEDCYLSDYTNAPADGSSAKAEADCGQRVSRGGSWNSEPEQLRSANRNWSNPGDGSSDNGFRLAQDL